jgi:hypothetical protein
MGDLEKEQLSKDCSSLSGKNQYANSVSGTKLSGTVPSALSGCSMVGKWKWTFHEEIYQYADGTLKAYDGGKLTATGTYAKQADGTYYYVFTPGWAGYYKLDSTCSKITGANQYTSDHNATKLSDSTDLSTAPVLPSDVPAHLSTCIYTGTWNTDWGTMVLAQEGTKVTGTYTHDSGKVSGTLVDGVYVGKWSESPSYGEPGDAGDMVFYFTKDCNGFSGTWHYGAHTSGAWSGTWVGTKVS